MHARTDRSLLTWQALSALLLLAMGGIHLYLVLFSGFDGLVGTLFVLNAIGGLVLAVAILATPRRFLFLVSVLSLLFMAGTLLGLVLALTPSGFLGVHEQFAAQLVTETLVVESIGTLVLLVTTLRARRG
jgi:hypothetical protein